jgi:hypothetical protein
MDQSDCGDHGIGGGDWPGQSFAVAHQLAIPMGGLAGEGPDPIELHDSSAGLPEQLDDGAYIRCREQAEMQLTATRSVLYRKGPASYF